MLVVDVDVSVIGAEAASVTFFDVPVPLVGVFTGCAELAIRVFPVGAPAPIFATDASSRWVVGGPCRRDPFANLFKMLVIQFSG